MKRNKMFYWPLMLVVLVSGLVFTGCSSDDDGDGFDKTLIYGSWSYTETTTEDATSVTMKVTYTFNSDNTASQRIYATMSYGNFIDDYVIEDVTNYYTYVYHSNSTITFTNKKGESWTNEITISGKKMRLGNAEDGYWNLTKTSSSVSSEIPADTPKDSVVLTLDYTFGESGDMTRATGAEVYTAFYEKYIKTKVLTPKTYSLTFTNKETGGTVLSINGIWALNNSIRLPEGEYKVSGYSRPDEIETYYGYEYPSDTTYLTFEEEIKISKEMTTLTLTAKYDNFLLLFDTSETDKIVMDGYNTKYLTNDQDVYWLFVRDVTYRTSSGSSRGNYSLNVQRKKGDNITIALETLPFEKGKYYYFNDMTNSFDIPMMEAGN